MQFKTDPPFLSTSDRFKALCAVQIPSEASIPERAMKSTNGLSLSMLSHSDRYKGGERRKGRSLYFSEPCFEWLSTNELRACSRKAQWVYEAANQKLLRGERMNFGGRIWIQMRIVRILLFDCGSYNILKVVCMILYGSQARLLKVYTGIYLETSKCEGLSRFQFDC